MDDSRSVQPPAVEPNPGQSEPVYCTTCGEAVWIYALQVSTSEINGFLSGQIDLLPFQRLEQGADGAWSLLYCRHCLLADFEEKARAGVRASVDVAGAAKDEREYFLSRLLFASRELAISRFTRSTTRLADGSLAPICVDCRMVQSDDRRLDHTPVCATGRVLSALDALMNVPPIPMFERRPCEDKSSSEPAQAAKEALPPVTAGFGEPWKVVSEDGFTGLEDRYGNAIIDAADLGLDDPDEYPVCERIAACVNACAGISNEALYRLKAAAVAEGGAR